MIRVVYFNQWFSSIALVIEDLKKRNKNKIKIIASSKNPDHAYKDYVDEFIVEDWEETDNHEESMRNYINWLIETLPKYHVDYFFVKKHAKEVMENSIEFALRDIFIVGEQKEKLARLNSKTVVFDELSENLSLKKYIPEYYRFETLSDAMAYINEHRGKNDICFKFDSDEGGQSYRSIDDSILDISSLYKYRLNTLTSDEAIRLLSYSGNDINKLIFMEKLDGPEISIDCYNSKNGFIAICRSKEDGRREKIYYDEYLYKLCEFICAEYKLNFPFNVQFRYKHTANFEKTGKHSRRDLRLLEINPRLSGGTYYEVFEGLNIADACLKDCMNSNRDYAIEDYKDFKPKYVAHLEYPIHLS